MMRQFLGLLLLLLPRLQQCDSSTYSKSVTVIHPRPLQLLLVDATDANDSNTHSIRLKLALDEVAAEIVSATAADPTSVLSKLTLRVVADGYHAFDFAWPFPLDFHVDMRLGTHTLEAARPLWTSTAL